ncbi:MAG: hypothetical protein IJJ68_08525 [Prevotella sp.]|nr:hypothetical protein [Prevotella sp.]
MTEIDKYGRIKNRNFQTQSVSRFPSYNDGYGSFWQRMNTFVSNIGDWINENRDNICTNISIGLYFLCWIFFAVAVIATWIKEGFLPALIGGIIGGLIVYYGAAILMYISLMVLHIIAWIFRLLFYNIYTLIIGVCLLGYYIYYVIYH